MIKKNFNLEINALNLVDKLDNRLQLFSVYQDLYMILIINTMHNNKEKVEEYSEYLTNTFISYVLAVKDKKEEINSKIIMNLYLDEIKKVFNYSPFKDAIEMFKSDLDEIFKKISYIDTISNSNYDFSFKCQLLTTFKVYVKSVFAKISQMYNDADSLKRKIGFSLGYFLEEILNKEDLDLDKFKINLCITTREIIINYYHNGEFNFFNLKRVISKDIVMSLDKIEKDLYISRLAYIISLYLSGESIIKIEEEYFRRLAYEYNVRLDDIIKRDDSLNFKIVEFEIKNNQKGY